MMGGIEQQSDWYQHYLKCKICRKRKTVECFIDLKKGLQLDVCKECLKDLKTMLSIVEG